MIQLMRKNFARSWFSFVGCLVLAVVACESDDGDQSPATGGAGGSQAGSGGAGGGATAGKGGGGSSATAGSAGTPTDAGTDAPVGCETARYAQVTSFGAVFDGWTVNNNSTASLVPVPGEGGAPGTGTIMEHDETEGSPTAGSAKLTIPFSDVDQELIFAKIFSPGVNMSGTTVTAEIKLDSGVITGPTDSATALLVLKSGPNYMYAPGTSVTLDPTAGWLTLSVNADAPNPEPPIGYNPCDIREIDVIIRTGSTGTYQEGVIHIDTVGVVGEDGAGGTGGTGGSDGGAAGSDAGAGGA